MSSIEKSIVTSVPTTFSVKERIKYPIRKYNFATPFGRTGPTPNEHMASFVLSILGYCPVAIQNAKYCAIGQVVPREAPESIMTPSNSF